MPMSVVAARRAERVAQVFPRGRADLRRVEAHRLLHAMAHQLRDSSFVADPSFGSGEVPAADEDQEEDERQDSGAQGLGFRHRQTVF
jgi:hypothetical protein